MTTTNSIPNQFYRVFSGKNFNDITVSGVHVSCFYQIISYNDLLTLQISGSSPTYKLIDAELHSNSMTNITCNYYKVNYNITAIKNSRPNVKRFYISLHEGGSEVMRSEGMNIDDETTKQIKCRNSSNFDDVEYKVSAEYFHLKIKAQFWQETTRRNLKIINFQANQLSKFTMTC